MEKKYETFTYSELVVEFRTVTEKTESLKRDLILEMAKRKELEGIEKKKIAGVITADLKELVSGTYVRNILTTSGHTDPIKVSGKTKKEILAIAGGGQEMAPPQEEEEPKVITNNNEDITNLIHTDEDIIDQRPESEKIQEANDATEDIDKIHLIRQLKVENNNLTQQISDLERLLDENKKLRQTISELEKENTGLYNRVKELEEENNRLKQENRALRNPPQVEQTAAIASRFSKTSHDDYHKNKYYKMTAGKGKK